MAVVYRCVGILTVEVVIFFRSPGVFLSQDYCPSTFCPRLWETSSGVVALGVFAAENCELVLLACLYLTATTCRPSWAMCGTLEVPFRLLSLWLSINGLNSRGRNLVQVFVRALSVSAARWRASRDFRQGAARSESGAMPNGKYLTQSSFWSGAMPGASSSTQRLRHAARYSFSILLYV